MSNNFIESFKLGKQGKNFGLSTGIPVLDQAINGLQKGTSIGLAAAPKCGKTTMCDYSFVISPYLQMLKLGKLDNVQWIYFSYEIDRVSKEFKFASFFMAHDFGVYSFKYKDKTFLMSQDYLMGRLIYEYRGEDQPELVQVSDEHQEMLKTIYITRIVPLFGEFDSSGKRISHGKIDFIEESENPTGINKYLFHYAKENGTFIEDQYYTINDQQQKIAKKRIIGYSPKNPDKFTIIIMDHVRKLRRERGFSMKENIDKWLEYSTFLRNICNFTFIQICHSNRQLANVDRLKYAGEFIFPTADEVKDTGNLAEESTILMTLFNPNDEKYNLKKHFGVELKEYPNYRSIHITESRYTECPVHMQVNMIGGINMFTPLNGY